MTSCLLSLALVLTPAPLTTPKEATTWPIPVIPVALPVMMFESIDDLPMVEWPMAAEMISPVSAVGTPEATPLVASPPPEPPPPTPAELVDAIFGWPGRQLVTCESNWNRWAVGIYGERGLFQIHPIHRARIAAMGYSFDDMFEVEPNIRVAAEIRRVQGLRAWTCWRGAA